MESVATTRLRIQVYKSPNLAGVFADCLKAKMFDEHRGEALLMFDFHGIEHAAIGINSDKKFLGGLKIAENLSGITHRSYIVCG